jgi:hypothetical protein
LTGAREDHSGKYEKGEDEFVMSNEEREEQMEGPYIVKPREGKHRRQARECSLPT